MTQTANTSVAARSEEAAQGCVIYHAPTGVVLSEVLDWFDPDDSVYVLRSTEFDLIAMDEDADRAINQFVEETFDLFFALLELTRTGAATAQELATFQRLSARILEIYEKEWEAERRARPPLVSVSFPRLQGPPRRGKLGVPPSSPAKQVQPSPA
jgi:hypothetical protein